MTKAQTWKDARHDQTEWKDRRDRSGRIDRYHRTLASLIAPAGNVADILIREGFTILYKPGREAYLQRAAHWCSE